MFAEASVVPGTIFDLRLWINVQERTFLVAALTCESRHTINKKKKRGQKHSRHFNNWVLINSQLSSSSVSFYETSSQRTKLGVEVAFGHLCHVVFVEKLALVSLLTKSSEPVLTHHRLLSADVTERTHPTWECKQRKI